MYKELLWVFLLLLLVYVVYNSEKVSTESINEGFSNKLRKFKSKKKEKFNNIGKRKKHKEVFKDTTKEDMLNMSSGEASSSHLDAYAKRSNKNRTSMFGVKNELYDYYKRFNDKVFTRKSKSVIDSLGKWKYYKRELYSIFE